MGVYNQLILTNFTLGMYDVDQLSRTQYPSGACVDCDNVIFTPAGALTKRPGYEQLSSTRVNSAAITKIFQWTDVDNGQHSFAFTCASATTAPTSAVSAAVYLVDTTGTEAAYIKLTLPANGVNWKPTLLDGISCASWEGSAIFTHSGNSKYMMAYNTGTSAVAVSGGTGTPSGAKVVCAWGNFLFAGNVLVDGVRNGSRLMWTYPGDVDNWPAAYYIDLDPDDGDEIRSIVNFKNNIYVFKRYKMWAIHWVGGVSLFQEERIAQDVGMVGPNAWITDGNIMYFIGDYTAYKFTGTEYPTSISDNIQSSWDLMNLSMAKWTSPLVSHGWEFEVESDPSNWQIWFHVPHLTSDYKNRIYVYDTRFNSWSKFSITASCLGAIVYGKSSTYGDLGDTYSSYYQQIQYFMAEGSSIMCIGDYTGMLHQYGSSNNDNGIAIDAYWVSPWLDMGIADFNKRFYRATALLERYGNYDLNVYFYRNWNEVTPSYTKTISLSGSADDVMVERRLDFTTQFRSLQLKFGTDDLASPFILHKFIINYLPKGQTLVT